jgi:hypothetical protein
MAQSLIAYAVVALAAVWTFRSLVPRVWRRRRKPVSGPGETGCGGDCGCGD